MDVDTNPRELIGTLQKGRLCVPAPFFYEQTMGFCCTNSGWTFNRNAAQLFEIDNFDGYVEPLAEYLPKQ